MLYFTAMSYFVGDRFYALERSLIPTKSIAGTALFMPLSFSLQPSASLFIGMPFKSISEFVSILSKTGTIPQGWISASAFYTMCHTEFTFVSPACATTSGKLLLFSMYEYLDYNIIVGSPYKFEFTSNINSLYIYITVFVRYYL